MIDQEAFLEKVEEWKRENPTTSIYFRPKCSSQDNNTDKKSECETKVKTNQNLHKIVLCLFIKSNCKRGYYHCVKSVRIRSYSGLHFPTFGLNTERYGVSFRIQSECGKIQTRINQCTTLWERVDAVGCYISHKTLRYAVILFSGKDKHQLQNCWSIYASENESEESITKALQILK